MNLILCVVVASILVNAIKPDKSVEEEIKEMKKILEQFKVKAESIKQKVEGHSELQNELETAVADTDKIIQILNNPLKIFGQQRKNQEKGKSKAEKNTLKEKLKSVKKKLPEVITTLDTLKSEANPISYPNFRQNGINIAIEVANYLSGALDSALKEEENDKKIRAVRNFALQLSKSIQNIDVETEHAKDLEKASKLKQSAFSAVEEFNKTLKDLLA